MRTNYKILIIIFLTLVVALTVYLKDGSVSPKCAILETNEKMDCLRSEVDKFLVKKQVGEALTFLKNYQLIDDNFYATDCHGIAHYIGDKAFGIYKTGVKIDFGNDSNVCVYGFYHAFTSRFVVAKDFLAVNYLCFSLESKSMEQAFGCYHGIGHGAIYDFFEYYGLRDPVEIINRGVDLCLTVLDKEHAVSECIAGVYDGIGDEVLDPQYKDLTPKKIFAYCADQPEKYKESCYENVAHLVYRKTKISFSDLVDFVVKNINEKYQAAAVKGLATIYVVDLKDGNIDEGVAVCKRLSTNLKKACFKRMTYKLASDALNHQEYEVISNFCKKNILTTEEAEMCFRSAVDNITNYYTVDEIVKRCSNEIEPYRGVCLNQINVWKN